MSEQIIASVINEKHLLETAHNFIKQLISSNEIDPRELGKYELNFFGSQSPKSEKRPTKKSDIDVKITYSGTMREDDLFNALNNKIRFNNIKIDFFPEHK